MNRERTKEVIKVMQHFVDGGDIEECNIFGHWQGQPKYTPSWDWYNLNFRIKRLVCDKAKEEIAKLSCAGAKMYFEPENASVSKELQEFLFTIGIDWSTGDGKIQYWSEDVLMVGVYGGKELTFGSLPERMLKQYSKVDLETGVVTYAESKTDKSIRELEEKLEELKEIRKQEK